MDKDTGLIHSKMIAIMRKVGAIDKERDNQAQRYKFRGIDDVYNALHSIMADEGVYCSLNVLEQSQVERTTKSGGAMFYTTAKVEYKFIAEDGSHVTMTPMGEGMDTGDKSNLKSLSNAHKACLLQAFLIPTQDKKDTEDDDHDVEPAPPVANPNDISDAQLKLMHTLFNKIDIKDRTGRLIYVNEALHISDPAKMINSSKALTKAQATIVLKVLSAKVADMADDEGEQPDLTDMPKEPPVGDPA